MNEFQSIESGKGFLKDRYEEDPSKNKEASSWLSERLKKKKQKIKDQIETVEK